MARHTISTAPTNRQESLARQFTGTAFLALEHTLFMGLVVVAPIVLAMSINILFYLWSSKSAASVSDVAHLFSLLGGLVVTVASLSVLYRRVSAELRKRPGFTNRLAYTIPLYSALAALAVAKMVIAAHLLGVFLQTVTLIGVRNAKVGTLYSQEFLPLAIIYVFIIIAGWYVFSRAKGRDMSRQFVNLLAFVGSVTAIAFFMTATTQLHASPEGSPSRPLRDAPSLHDYLDRYNY